MKLIEIFSTGKHKDSNGNEKYWTVDDLDKIVYQSKNVHKNSPICVGHPQSNSPAYGWLDNVQRIGDRLYTGYKGVQNEFKEAVNKGLFKNRSISLDADLNIRHLAFLGAQAPAIKGLENFCFEDDKDAQNIDFEDFEDVEIVENEEKKGQEKLENEKMQKEIESKSAKIAELELQIANDKKTQKTKEFEDFCDKAIEKGNILPKHKESIVNILTACDSAEKFNFSDSEPKSGVEVVKKFVSSLKTMNFEDVANKKDAGQRGNEFSDSAQYASKIKELIKKEGMTEVEAYFQLTK